MRPLRSPPLCWNPFLSLLPHELQLATCLLGGRGSSPVGLPAAEVLMWPLTGFEVM